MTYWLPRCSSELPLSASAPSVRFPSFFLLAPSPPRPPQPLSFLGSCPFAACLKPRCSRFVSGAARIPSRSNCPFLVRRCKELVFSARPDAVRIHPFTFPLARAFCSPGCSCPRLPRPPCAVPPASPAVSRYTFPAAICVVRPSASFAASTSVFTRDCSFAAQPVAPPILAVALSSPTRILRTPKPPKPRPRPVPTSMYPPFFVVVCSRIGCVQRCVLRQCRRSVSLWVSSPPLVPVPFALPSSFAFPPSLKLAV
eukprot:TRINITY_DN21771_c0_g2_i2.p2 TRINITY_DN21771_c0_g2~~TRINITY_DN21771_c0_g2_i2.p2  ORF type:complete len:255 (-),score=-41.91 TRINITY_DN21771_c0_g2_i2:544-1308(-)